jgi:hypothetical protein
MNRTKWLTCALLGFGLTMPLGEMLITTAQAETEVTAESSSAVRRDPRERRDRHNRQWRKAKQRAREAGRRGNAREVLRQFRNELNNQDIVVNVCVINVINKAENVVAIGGDVNQVVNIINGSNCEIR